MAEPCTMCGKENVSLDSNICKEKGLSSNIPVCHVCAESIRVDTLCDKLKPDVDRLFDTLNSMGSSSNRIIIQAIEKLFFKQHRYLQGEAIMLLINIVRKLGSYAGNACYEDDRNNWALKWMKKAGDLL